MPHLPLSACSARFPWSSQFHLAIYSAVKAARQEPAEFVVTRNYHQMRVAASAPVTRFCTHPDRFLHLEAYGSIYMWGGDLVDDRTESLYCSRCGRSFDRLPIRKTSALVDVIEDCDIPF